MRLWVPNLELEFVIALLLDELVRARHVRVHLEAIPLLILIDHGVQDIGHVLRPDVVGVRHLAELGGPDAESARVDRDQGGKARLDVSTLRPVGDERKVGLVLDSVDPVEHLEAVGGQRGVLVARVVLYVVRVAAEVALDVVVGGF